MRHVLYLLVLARDRLDERRSPIDTVCAREVILACNASHL